jgi:hypothetical protein
MRELLASIYWRNHILSLSQLGFSLLVLSVAVFYYFDTKGDLAEAKNWYASQQLSNEEARGQSQILQGSLGAYRQLQVQGNIGEPRRLQWLEALRTVGDRYQIQSMDFTLEGSELIQENVDLYWNAEVPIRATNMKLLMKLSHEGDLYRVFEGLREEAQGLFSVEKCQIKWLDTYSEDYALTRLRGECLLRWYTLADVTSTWAGEAK